MQRFQDFARNVLTGAPAPLASITVVETGTDDAITLYDDDLSPPTAKANPFTADLLTGYFAFYAANGRYDIVVTPAGVGIPAYTLADVQLFNLI